MSERFVHPAIPAAALGRLARVMERWIEEEGATEVPLAWMVPRIYVDATCPPGRDPQPFTPHGHLVASGEQTFLQLAAADRLPDAGTFIGWTPCFRDEAFDALHHYAFVKAEIFAWTDPDRPEAEQIIGLVERARRVLQHETDAPILPHPLPDGTWDLTLHGIEIGSYGARSLLDGSRRYLYGTALAEPRFTRALKGPP